METKPVFHRTGKRTYVSVAEDMIGVIVRETVSNSSPRGGAYRTVHFAYKDYRRRKENGKLFYTRKEAAEWLLDRHNERDTP